MRSTPWPSPSFVLSPPRNSSATASMTAGAIFRDGILATRSIIPRMMNRFPRRRSPSNSNNFFRRNPLVPAGSRSGPRPEIPKKKMPSEQLLWRSMIHSGCQLAEKNSKFKSRGAIKTEGCSQTASNNPGVHAGKVLSLFFGFASAAPDKFSAYPLRSPEPFRYAAVVPHFCAAELGIQVHACHSVQTVSFLTER